MKAVLAMVALFALVALAGWANADDESATLGERVQALEERLGALERGGEGRDLRVRSLTVVDEEGNPRVSLGQGRPHKYGLLVQDAQGRERIALNMDSSQVLRLRFRARTGAPRLGLYLNSTGAGLGVNSPSSSVGMSASREGWANFTMRGGPGKQNERSRVGFHIWPDGTIALGGGQQSAGHTGFHLKQSRDGALDCSVRDHEQALLWEMPQRHPPTPVGEWNFHSALRSADGAEQRKGFKAVAAALAGDDPRSVRRALWALRGAREGSYDREAMEGLVRKHLDSASGPTRVVALWALLYVRGYKSGDLESALKVVATEDFAVLQSVAQPLLLHAQKKIDGGAIEAAFLRLLRHERIEVALGAAQALTKARASIAVQEALIALWREHRGRYHQVVEGLTKVKPRSLPVVKALLEELSLPDTHGLHRDVRDALGDAETDETKAVTVAGALRLLEVVKSEESLMSLVNLLRRFGTSSDADELERILASVSLPTNIKRFGKMVLPEMRRR